MLQETLEIKARRYSPVIYSEGGNKVFLPAESYAIGDILVTPPKTLYGQLKAWQEFRKHPPEDIKRLLFEVAPSYFIQTPQKTSKGKYQRRKEDILSLSPALLKFALLRKLFAEKGSYNLWKIGGDRAINSGSGNNKKPYTGKVILTGNAKAMERGGRGNIPTYYSINITNPFGLPEGFYCSCEDFRWTDAKEGPVNVQGACTHTAGLHTYIHENPTLVRNSLNVSEFESKEFFLPYNFRKSQIDKLDRLHIEELEYLSAEDLDLSHLKIDALVDHLFNRSNYFSIGKKLLLIPHIYNPQFLEGILNGKVFYEVVIQENVKRDVDPNQLKDTKKMLGEMLKQLEIKDYKLQGYALEFRGSLWETVCMNYENGNNILRILFNEKFPPVFVFRKMKPDSATEPFLLEKYNHPFSYLFERSEKIDDRTKKTTSFEVRLPTQIKLPDSLKVEYKKSISEHFEGGLEGLASKLKGRKEVGSDELIFWLCS